MDEPQNNSQKSEHKTTPPAPRAAKQTPAIRTMKTDMEELFQTTKPTLIQMIGRGAAIKIQREPRHNQSSFFKKFLISLVIILFAGGGTIFFLTQRQQQPIPPPATAPKPPSPLFSVEESEIISGGFSHRAQLFQKIDDAVREGAREGTFKHILLEISEENTKHWATFDDIISLYRIEPPAELIIAVKEPVMMFSYYSTDGPRVGIALVVRDLNRALRGLFAWESSLLKDVTPLFFGETLEPTVAPFEDRTFRNIDWRFLSLSREKDLGIAHSVFPASQILILTTSKESFETVVNRLYGR